MRIAVFAAALLLAAGAAAAQTADAPPRSGKVLFDEHCTLCHNARGHATNLMGKRLGPDFAILEARDNPSADMIETVVRQGFNSMPAFRRAELNDAELKAMLDYLTQPKDRRR